MPIPLLERHGIDALPRGDALSELAARQDSVVRRDQLAAIDHPRGHLDAQLAAHRWQSLGAVVIVLHNGPLTARQAEWAAVLNAGRFGTVALCGRTAAQRFGLERWPTPKIEIVVPRGTTVPALTTIATRVHESRRFTSTDVHPALLPPQTRIERSIVDAATWSQRPRTACGLLAAAVQQRLTTPDRLNDELTKAGSIRHRKIMSAALRDIGGGAHALSEIDLGPLCRRFGLPAPERQVVRTDRHGRRRYIDARIRGPRGRVVNVEIDGALHLLVQTYWDDMERDNELVISGEPVLRFPSIAVRLESARVADQIARALGLSGSQRVPAA